jgi:hypothetical protein
MQNDATVEDIVNMTSHVVLKAQQMHRGQAQAAAEAMQPGPRLARR